MTDPGAGLTTVGGVVVTGEARRGDQSGRS